MKMLYTVYKQEGAGELWRRFRFRCFRVNSFYVFTLNLAASLPKFGPSSTLTISERTFRELDRLRKDQPGLTSEFFRDRIGTEKRCFLATTSDNNPACIIWISPTPSSGFVTADELHPEMNHIFCIPRYRGQHLCTATVSFLSHCLQEEGCRFISVVTHEDNIALMTVIRRCGFRHTGQIIRRWAFFKWPLKVVPRPS